LRGRHVTRVARGDRIEFKWIDHHETSQMPGGNACSTHPSAQLNASRVRPP
jgi:hypothetical protein